MLALRNLLTNDKLELGPDMVEAGLPKVVLQRKTQVGCLCNPHILASTPCRAWPLTSARRCCGHNSGFTCVVSSNNCIMCL